MWSKFKKKKKKNAITSLYLLPHPFLPSGPSSQSNFKCGEPETASRCPATSRLELHFGKAWKKYPKQTSSQHRGPTQICSLQASSLRTREQMSRPCRVSQLFTQPALADVWVINVYSGGTPWQGRQMAHNLEINFKYFSFSLNQNSFTEIRVK